MAPVVDRVPGRASNRHKPITAAEGLEHLVRRHEAALTEKLLTVNPISGMPSPAWCASFSGVADSPIDSQWVAKRLRAVMGDLELETVGQLARFLGAERSQVSNWLQGYNLPPARWMSVLCRKRPGLTLDWIYRGVADALPIALAIKLEALSQGYEVPLTAESSAKESSARKAASEAAPIPAPKAKARKRAT